MSRAERIEAAIREKLQPTAFTIADDSSRHAGHAGWRPEGETHYRVTVVSVAFQGLGRVDRQRLVYGLLADEFAGGLHALALRTLTPEEENGR